ncbi:hypothetical protein B0J12DRAFT_325841 [Macrophomina phaseolina]|uniref:Secreted protein n=1 Tax=Macrophomina phaseolina TaxID=35725 RepID=A0ABQ8FV49_9PEZI|nr:hypothetical protein B0J12DRAFT_325841 [Macrophomina phaseolina]
MMLVTAISGARGGASISRYLCLVATVHGSPHRWTQGASGVLDGEAAVLCGWNSSTSTPPSHSTRVQDWWHPCPSTNITPVACTYRREAGAVVRGRRRESCYNCFNFRCELTANHVDPEGPTMAGFRPDQ